MWERWSDYRSTKPLLACVFALCFTIRPFSADVGYHQLTGRPTFRTGRSRKTPKLVPVRKIPHRGSLFLDRRSTWTFHPLTTVKARHATGRMDGEFDAPRRNPRGTTRQKDGTEHDGSQFDVSHVFYSQSSDSILIIHINTVLSRY